MPGNSMDRIDLLNLRMDAWERRMTRAEQRITSVRSELQSYRNAQSLGDSGVEHRVELLSADVRGLQGSMLRIAEANYGC